MCFHLHKHCLTNHGLYTLINGHFEVMSSQTASNVKKDSADGSLEAALPGGGDGVTANIIDWNGPDDAANPINWPSHTRWAHIITVALLGLIP